MHLTDIMTIIGAFTAACVSVLSLTPLVFLKQESSIVKAVATEFHMAGDSLLYGLMRLASFPYLARVQSHLLAKFGLTGAAVVVIFGEAAGLVALFWLVRCASVLCSAVLCSRFHGRAAFVAAAQSPGLPSHSVGWAEPCTLCWRALRRACRVYMSQTATRCAAREP